MLSEKIFAIAHYADQVVLFILLVLSIISIGIIFERFMYLKKVSNESERIRTKVKMALQTHSVQDFEDIAKDPTSVEGRVAGYALKHLRESGLKGFEEVFNAFVLTEKPELEKFLNFLATIGSNAPYIGLLGTVLGIMKAFNDLAITPEAGQQTVMSGISVALIATAAGLFVAIPAVIFFNYFKRKVVGILQSVESVKELGLAFGRKRGL